MSYTDHLPPKARLRHLAEMVETNWTTWDEKKNSSEGSAIYEAVVFFDSLRALLEEIGTRDCNPDRDDCQPTHKMLRGWSEHERTAIIGACHQLFKTGVTCLDLRKNRKKK